MQMSKEQFREGVQALIEDIKNPNGEMAGGRKEFQELYDAIAPHDAELATCFGEIMGAMDRLVLYVQQRSS